MSRVILNTKMQMQIPAQEGSNMEGSAGSGDTNWTSDTYDPSVPARKTICGYISFGSEMMLKSTHPEKT